MDISRQYEDPYAAQAAVEWFNDKDFHGTIIEVLMAESKTGKACCRLNTLELMYNESVILLFLLNVIGLGDTKL
ncbi:Nucleotide-binding, alpha-beta plait [Artemisia annua]|uniref:Nucleotide-binding, alpha-beta plait n=1 Tax=Artemisia annua TaxID=35608 RepID=A0A2U1LAN3_ARTAN|nr:Nucleotide-binding, alpha-beta plait [Artemisia annua]